MFSRTHEMGPIWNVRLRAILIIATAIPTCSIFARATDAPRVFVLRPDALQRVRESVRSSKLVPPAVAAIRSDADLALKVPLLTVTDKTSTPPSGDKHDYMSLAPYWWPDPKSPNGLPYIRRDGERNPELKGFPDHTNFDKLMSSVRKLALAYYIFGDERYATKATELLRAWFIDPPTRMNPNLQYAQAVKGHNDGRGTGLIETRGIGSVVDAVGMLAGSRSWTGGDQSAMEKWCADFLDWMLNSSNGKDEAAATNNHGTFYDVQVASLALFVGRTDFARKVLEAAAQQRIAAQVQPDGSQPRELGRTKSFSYSVFNLTAMFELARLGENVGVDLWSFRSNDGRGIRAAIEYLLPYALNERKWPYQQIEPIKPRELVPLLLEASFRFRAPEYQSAALKIDATANSGVQSLLIEAASSKQSTRK